MIQTIIGKKHFSFSRTHLLTETQNAFAPPQKLTAQNLKEIFVEVLKAIEPVINLPTDVIRKTINIQEKIEQIRQRIFNQAQTKFSEILRDAKDKTEVVVSFLALLELVKQRIILVKQEDTFADILIERLS